MKVGLIGSGGMGEGLSCHIMNNDIEVWGYTNEYPKTEEHYEKGHISGCTSTLEYLAYVVHHNNEKYINPGNIPGVFMITLPSEEVDGTLTELVDHCVDGDIIINNSNFNFKTFTRRKDKLSKLGIQYIDCDTSNDSVMISGSTIAMSVCSPIFKALAPGSKWNEVSVWGASC